MSDPFAGTSVASFDMIPDYDAFLLMQSCCGSTAWAQGMVSHRPFGTLGVMLHEADELWWSLTPDDWREAFDHHPRIGERASAVARGEQAARWSAAEQQGVASAGTDVRQALADGNRAYEERFGHIYLVCATGKPAEELLALLRSRLQNDSTTELRIAAGEQAKITRLRLQKMFGPSSPPTSP